ncbi:LysR family transcriptional regulator [Nocardioides anomalus]|uniref:LysR family transcriptional regulator n=1 Tax=Nocardioides anomalus TaxID=2712223 RepID=A0A6G6W907_9ACTN|nr:LysR family transcriptional regulator [Nocardioides anomalus]QIG41689.1 LysR family transcriptional regulator [Nocardioides anomalus]
MPTLRALECLVAVADCGSITQAALHLHSSQPAVSHQLATLEREARTPLVRRVPRGVVLTPAGRAALAHARTAVEAASSSVRAARAVDEGTAGTVRLAVAQSLTVALAAPTIRDWHRRRPDVSVALRELVVMDDAVTALEAGEVDLALVPAPAPASLHAVEVAEEEVVLTAAADHPLAARAAVRLEELEGLDLVHFAPENSLRGWLDEHLVRARVRATPVVRTAVTAAAPQLAAAGLGVAVTPVSAVTDGFPGAVRPFEPRWTRRLLAVTLAEPDPLVARFVADVRRRGLRVPGAVRRQLG